MFERGGLKEAAVQRIERIVTGKVTRATPRQEFVE
jgi:hypothetical protein